MAPPTAALEPPDERPRPVTIIGWTFLVLSLLRILFDALTWFVWKVGNAEPVVSFFLPKAPGGSALALRHLPAVLAVQGAIAAGVALVAYQFLRLRAWARSALEIVCYLALAVAAAIAVTLSLELSRTVGSESRAVGAVVAGLLVVAALLARAIWTIRRPDIRRAFRSGEDARPAP